MQKILLIAILFWISMHTAEAQTEISYKDYVLKGNVQMVTITLPDGKTEVVSFDAKHRLTKLDNSEGVFTYAYNASGKLTAITSSTESKAIFTYDAKGLLISKKDIWGHPWKYKYDKKNRKIQETSIQKGNISSKTYINYQYSDSGILLQKLIIDSINYNSTLVVYNKKGEATEERYIDLNGEEYFRWLKTYDDNGNAIKAIRMDKDKVGMTINYTYTFDEKGNWITKTIERDKAKSEMEKREIVYLE